MMPAIPDFVSELYRSANEVSSGHQPHVAEPFLKQMPKGRWPTEDEIAAPMVFRLVMLSP
jgi:hypothetical protein